jgi:hypothetical protein
VDEAEAREKVTEVLGDGAYDAARLYDVLKGKGIDAVIKPRRDSILNTRSEARRSPFRCQSIKITLFRARLSGGSLKPRAGGAWW